MTKRKDWGYHSNGPHLGANIHYLVAYTPRQSIEHTALELNKLGFKTAYQARMNNRLPNHAKCIHLGSMFLNLPQCDYLIEQCNTFGLTAQQFKFHQIRTLRSMTHESLSKLVGEGKYTPNPYGLEDLNKDF